MNEAWLIELLSVIRDAARRSDMPRLAEHLDDAALIAASEMHEREALLGGDRFGVAY
jgi:hypothetical protein